MDYESIKKEYSEQNTRRANKIAIAKARVESLRETVKLAEQERELYRQRGGTIDAEQSKNWWRLTDEIKRLNKRLDEAKHNVLLCEVGEDGINEVVNHII